MQLGPIAAALLGSGAVLFVLGARRKLQAVYRPDPERPYGPKWGRRRPPGLPPSARKASRPGAARDAVLAAARAQALGPAFERAVLRLAEVESGLTFGRPTNTFDARCREAATAAERRCTLVDGRRPSSKRLTTAWGVFQVTVPTWQAWTGSRQQPWEASAVQEVEVPVRQLARHWRAARAAGAPDWAAQRALFLGHNKPAALRQFLREGPRMGWETAWRFVRSIVYGGRVDRYLS